MQNMVRLTLPEESPEQSVAREISRIDNIKDYECDLLETISTLHCTVTGVSERHYGKGIHAAWVRCLERRIEQWRPNSECSRYDLAVKELCLSALAEYKGSWLEKYENEK